jgi:RNA polymerase sigma-70 factor (ECF subfamily)
VKTDAPPTGAFVFRDELLTHLPQLRAFCRFLCRGQIADADDLAQETLMRAWAARKSFTPGTMMRAWLFVIARNFYYSSKRKQRFTSHFDVEQVQDELKTPGAQEAVLDLDEVRRAVDLLPQNQRDALILVTAGGLSYEEAAQVCQCAVGTAKSRVNRARAALLKILAGPLPKSGASADTALDQMIRDAQRLAGDG